MIPLRASIFVVWLFNVAISLLLISKKHFWEGSVPLVYVLAILLITVWPQNRLIRTLNLSLQIVALFALIAFLLVWVISIDLVDINIDIC